MGMQVAQLMVYPVKGEPGQELSTATVEQGGLTGDRRKKAAVHLVQLTDMDTEEPPRANIVLDTPDDLTMHIGSDLVVGTATLHVTGTAKNCPGVYAEVVQPGQVSVGDPGHPA